MINRLETIAQLILFAPAALKIVPKASFTPENSIFLTIFALLEQKPSLVQRSRLIFFYLFLLFAAPLHAGLLDDFGAKPLKGEAPSFTLPDVAGQHQPLKQWRGRVILLNFWATWCGPCRAEMSGMEHLWQRYRDDGFVIVAVSVDEGVTPRVAKFIEILSLTYPVLLDTKHKVGDLYQVGGIPYSVLIDREGQLIAEVVGQREWDGPEAEALIERLLRKH